MTDFKPGELIIYKKGTQYQIGKIYRLCTDGAYVWYHSGNTASKTRFEDMHKIENGYCITDTIFNTCVDW